MEDNRTRISLTVREQEVLERIAGGWTSEEIAIALEISSETVKTYRKTLLLKLGARNTANLIYLASKDEWTKLW